MSHKACLKKPLSPWLLYGIVALVVFIVDQVTKAAVLLAGPLQAGFPGLLTLRAVTNSGAAFSLAPGYSVIFLIIAAAVIVLLTLYIVRIKPQSTLILVAAGLIAGGATGNALDRLLGGSVIDFISLDCIRFPVFNLADAAITCGFALIILSVVCYGAEALIPQAQRMQGRRPRKQKQDEL